METTAVRLVSVQICCGRARKKRLIYTWEGQGEIKSFNFFESSFFSFEYPLK